LQRPQNYTLLQPISMPPPTVSGKGNMFFGSPSVVLPSVRLSVNTDFARRSISEWNLSPIYITWLGIAEKVVKVRSQKSRSRPDELTCNGGGIHFDGGWGIEAYWLLHFNSACHEEWVHLCS